MRTRFVQLVVMIAGLFALGPSLGITGVALAVDLMLVVGIVALLWQARAYVDFSPRRMFLVPSLALVLGLAAGWAAAAIPGVADSLWLSGIVKIAAFSAAYAALLLLLEADQIPMLIGALRQLLPDRPGPDGQEEAK
jgi:O-antigen/teichoic acid export membrane protein